MNGVWYPSQAPIWQEDRGTATSKWRNKGKTNDASTSGPPSSFRPSFSSRDSSKGHVAPVGIHSASITELLGPAVEGPPSPESLRALSKQMKRSSFLDKRQSQNTSSSGSSSLLSLTSADRPSWEHSLVDGAALSRKSSGRSTTSSMQHRDRPESVQIFGKSLFNRGKGRMRRESSAQSSATSSVYSGDGVPLIPPPPPPPPPASTNRDTLVPAFLGRRRLKPEAGAPAPTPPPPMPEPRRRFQISGPYNFQHLTHGQRPEETPKDELAADHLPKQAQQFPQFTSEPLPVDEEQNLGLADTKLQASMNRPLPSGAQQQQSPTRPIMNYTRSEEQLRSAPPRPPRSPPRSPVNADFFMKPVPPPRVSSRTSTRYDGLDPLSTTTLERPQTSSGFRQPTPLAIMPEDAVAPFAYGHAHASSIDLDSRVDQRYSRLVPDVADDTNWPLPCPITTNFENALPDVPEEEEHAYLGKKSRMSVASNTSSLRGSQSVPLLRQSALAQSTQRPSSGASDTLGRFDLFAAQRALRTAWEEGAADIPRDTWEDDIDYCYDHEAEADCDYAWERPSLDVSREADNFTHERGYTRIGPHANPTALLLPSHNEVPGLSPVSQVSAMSMHEAITPTAPTSNFSLPRMGTQPRVTPTQGSFLHVRSSSRASSFKESHGFNLSPTLLIPDNAYHQQMLAHEKEQQHGNVGDRFPDYDEPFLMEKSALFVKQRVSASTTGSQESLTHSERHISTTSTATDYTALTVDAEDIVAQQSPIKGDSGKHAELSVFPSVVPDLPERSHLRVMSEPRASASDDELPFEAPPSPNTTRRRLLRKTKDDTNRVTKKTDLSVQVRRGRAHTTSLSTPPPPASFGLFPKTGTTSADARLRAFIG